MEQYNIKEVAIYLRKSRDETDGKEDVLAKHEALLLEYAKANNFKYKKYKEIGSAENIDQRPEMLRLLADVALDLYDAVLVVDLDRLSRGDFEDIGRLRRCFRDANTLVITPTKVYDFNNSEQEVMTDIEQVFAKFEYQQIKKRMIRGKKQGAKAGKWTNGKPPFPYLYNRISKDIEVDETKREFYEFILQRFMEGLPCYEIAWELNRLGVPSPSGKSVWQEATVYRTLMNEVHMGKIIYGKTQGSGHIKNKGNKQKELKAKDRSEWILVDGTHEVLKTEEQHAQILSIMESRKLYRPKGTARKGTHILSGIMYCGKCGKSLQILKRANGKLDVKPCQSADPVGNRCKNSGISANVVYYHIDQELTRFEDKLKSESFETKSTEASSMKMLLDDKENELTTLDRGFDRIMDLYVEGMIDKNRLNEMKEQQTELVQKKKEEIHNLKQALGHFDGRNADEKLEELEQLKKVWTKVEEVEPKDVNRFLGSIFKKIILQRKGKDYSLHFEYTA
jgi:site-specific DNA recombinase